MKCPACGCVDSRVLDSRPVDDDSSIRRRRECPVCGRRFTTYEVVDSLPVTVIKRDGGREFFNKQKLAAGIARACQKRPVDAEAVASSIEADLQNGLVSEITSKDIGDLVLDRLRRIDVVSYIRFASVYREFQDIDSFMAEIRRISKKEKVPAAITKTKEEKHDD